ncbi:HGS [Lepeophtheirus salmonis]|uniref:HGS n=1 Tax=Lepeophtheirus salmonis TaxID=72036 RepID=A0A7R8H5Z4_LEPSM|nr:HGS [Lepeophtheirus salmonis]CAF2892358.1 HGS [Lepeophtheirus salmonis]
MSDHPKSSQNIWRGTTQHGQCGITFDSEIIGKYEDGKEEIVHHVTFIRSGETNPKYAVLQIKKKFTHANPHVSLFALQVMESCVKNCGSFIHEEIATREFMEEIREKYRICTDTYNIMKAEGWKFPPVVEADAMFEADTAPAWVEGTVCHRCRVEFGVMTRQHHCRACEKEVRVCESCFDTHGPKDHISPINKSGRMAGNTEDLPPEYLSSSLAQQNQTPTKTGKSEAEIKEEEELQLAIALSKSEAEEKEKKINIEALQFKITQIIIMTPSRNHLLNCQKMK